MASRKAEVTITGISPVLMNRFPLEGSPAGMDKRPKEEQAEHVAYRDPASGELCMPSKNIYVALISAAAYTKWKGVSTLKKPVAASVFVKPDLVSYGTKNYIIDSQPVRNPTTGGKIIKHRPRINDWKLTFQLEWDDALVSDTQMKKVVEDMGKLVGLSDYRPENCGPFGRFVVSEWKQIKS